LDKVHIRSDNPEFNATTMQAYIRQRPNYKMFGLNKTQLQIYSLSGKDSTKWINRQMRRLGEPPVVYDSVLVHKTEEEFRKLLANRGYLHAEIRSSVKKEHKKAEVIYDIRAGEPYRIDSFDMLVEDSTLLEDLTDAPPAPSYIRQGSPFDMNVLDNERQRIVDQLRNRGYYAFDKEFISYIADTACGNNTVDLQLLLHPYSVPAQRDQTVPHAKYRIDRVCIYADYNPLRYGGIASFVALDSVQMNDYTVYYGKPGRSMRPKVLLEKCFISPGSLYSERQEALTYAAFASLKALENIHIYFPEKMRNDSSLLDCYILTMPAKKQTFSTSLEGTNSAGNLGFASSLAYQHRNIFRGSETFGVKLTGAYESMSENFSENYVDLGVQTTLTFPKIIFPFLRHDFKRQLQAVTEIAMSYSYQTRPEYSRTLMSGGLRYIWQDRIRHWGRHQLNLLDINYVYLPRVDETFWDRLPLNAALFSYMDQFIVGMGYSYAYSTFNAAAKRRNVNAFRISVESAGNILYGLSSIFKASKGVNDSYELFGIYYAQYLKGDVDYSRTLFIDRKNAVAWHVAIGAAVPYGNSSTLPFEKRYYSGGANSVRGWAVRSLGPGSYRTIEGKTTFYEQSADIKLDLSIEYRSHLFWKMELAAFVDAGNIWTIKDYEGQENGNFRFNKFYKEIALSYGLGIRLDFDFFLLRLDAGMKAYDPALMDGEKWSILHPNLKNNFAWHFAVGYPF
jgi:outer membrane protein assembly factor BamA